MQLGLFARLTITLSIVLTLAMAVLGTVLLLDTQKRFNETQLHYARSQAKILAEASLDALITADYELLERWVVSVVPDKPYAYAYLAKSNGQVLTHSNNIMVARYLDAMGELDTFKVKDSTYLNRPVKEVFYPAKIGDKHLANAVVAYYLDTHSFLNKNSAIKIILIIVISLTLLLGVTLFIIRKFTTPLSLLTEYIGNTSITNKNFHIDNALLNGWGEVGFLARAFESMIKRLREAFDELSHEEERLKEKVEERTYELQVSNQELEKFSYSVSHDLRAPLRVISSFSDIILEDYFDSLDDSGKEYLNLIKDGTVKMDELIDNLLQLSMISRKELELEEVNLSLLATEILDRYRYGDSERKVKITIEDNLVCHADRGLMIIVLENLLGNAWKYSSKQDCIEIEVGQTEKDNSVVYFVRDHGAGFNMKYKNKLFEAFQRLHTESEFKGTGIGLATVARVIARHKGKIWAESEEGKGSTFYFSL